jgi:hypothetical protein
MDPVEIAASRIPAVSDLGYLDFALILKAEEKVKEKCGRDETRCPVRAGREPNRKMAIPILLNLHETRDMPKQAH